MSTVIRRPSPARRIGGWFGVLAAGALPVAIGAESAGPGFESDLRPLIVDLCVSCHGAEKQRGDVDLEPFLGEPRFGEQRELWEKVRDALANRDMPPDNKPQPTEQARQQAVRLLDREFERLDASLPPNPGRVTLRRLNRNEYRNTIRDLVGIDYDTQAHFPHDESGYGFDNIGDVLSLPPMLMEKYLAAAEEIARRTIVTEDPARKRVHRIPARGFTTQADAISTVEEEVWGFYREGEITTEYVFPAAGDYVLRLRAYGEQAGSELPKLVVRVDGREVHVHPVRAGAEKPETFEVPVTVAAGAHRLGVAYPNNFNADGDRNVYLAAFEVVGPLGGPPDDYPEPHRRLLPRRPEPGRELALARESLGAFATRAYRRPVTASEVERLVRFVELGMKDGLGFEAGMQLALQAALVSPHFLYRWELDPEALSPGGTRDLDDYEVASRLSYFLWSSMPDAELFDQAARGDLRRPGVLEAQVRRMLRDPRSDALVRNFGGQWLQVRNLDQVEPDASLFPGWSVGLRDAARRETELYFRAILDEDRTVQELVASDFTYLNEALARHYGIPGVEGPEFRRVTLPAGSPRGGVLTMASVLTITSVPTRTSPVLRGKWILEQILGTPPPPPPPNVPPIEEGAEASKSATLRQRLELHRSKPDCLGCHQRMDPLGFALENFDAVGAWRDQDGPHPIDNAAELPGGRRFVGAEGLKEIVRKSDDFPRALAGRLLTYALGRGLEPYDRRTVRILVDDLEKNGFKFSSLVLGIVRSDPFLKRQPESVTHDRHASANP
jgi:hypothetical protein